MAVGGVGLVATMLLVRPLIGTSSTQSLTSHDYLLRAHAERLQGNETAAEVDATYTISLDDQSWDGYNTRALVRVTTNQLRGALADANQAVALCLDNTTCNEKLPDLLDTRGYVYLKLARYESALQDYQRAIDAGFRYPTVMLGRGLAYAALGQTASAREDLATLRQPPQVPAYSDPELQDLVMQARHMSAILPSGNQP
jgi:tetratricopeptide (TPR) repeat protein